MSSYGQALRSLTLRHYLLGVFLSCAIVCVYQWAGAPQTHSDFVAQLYAGRLLHSDPIVPPTVSYHPGKPSSSPSESPSASPSASPSSVHYTLDSMLTSGGQGKARMDVNYMGEMESEIYTGDVFEAKPENEIKQTILQPVSTFSVDVDTSSYSYSRRHLKHWQMPPPNSVKTEEFINYFDYEYPQPKDKSVPFETSVAVSDSPWNKGRKLMHIGIKGYDIDPETRPFSNIVFLVDVSGSMGSRDKLPLAKEAIELLLKSLLPEDIVSIVTYASNVNVPLSPTQVAHKDKILQVLESLQAHGSTWGGGGIEKAYEVAEKNFDKDAINRIMLVTDGDFNIGKMDPQSLQKYIESKRETGIFLSVLGFGMGNYKDTTMKALANHGNGVAAYIDSLEEAEKVMVTEASSTIFPIAKDVKVQVEFNPTMVAEYRLVGYEKRLLKREDFNNDKVDAGDIGSGHTVTAIYEIRPVGSMDGLALDELRYGPRNAPELTAKSREMQETESLVEEGLDQEYAFVKMRYKLPNESESKLISKPVTVEDHMDKLVATGGPAVEAVMQEFLFATAVASFAQLLKGSHSMNGMDYEKVIELAESSIGDDPHRYRKEFVNLVRTAKRIGQEQGLNIAQ